MLFLCFLPLARMTCFSSAKTQKSYPALGCAVYSQTKPARIDVVSVEKKWAENRPFSHSLGDHDILRWAIRKNLEKGQTEKNCLGEPGGISAAHGVDTRLAAAAAPSALRMGRSRNMMITNTNSTTPPAAGFGAGLVHWYLARIWTGL